MTPFFWIKLIKIILLIALGVGGFFLTRAFVRAFFHTKLNFEKRECTNVCFIYDNDCKMCYDKTYDKNCDACIKCRNTHGNDIKNCQKAAQNRYNQENIKSKIINLYKKTDYKDRQLIGVIFIIVLCVIIMLLIDWNKILNKRRTRRLQKK